MTRRLTVLAITIAVLASLFGCGGGGSSKSARGRVQVTVAWPTRSRLIPLAANSIKVSISADGIATQTLTIVRPQTKASFADVPPGSFTMTATAYPNADGTGTALAVASVPVTVVASQTVSPTLTMDSTIDHVELALAGGAYVEVHRTRQVVMTAKDASGSVVMTTPGKIAWGSGNTGVATVDGSGNVYGATLGNATISATETESGKSATLDVSVIPVALSALYFCAWEPQVVRINDMAGGGMTQLKPQLGCSQLVNPESVATSSDGHIYIADTGNNRIVRWNDATGAGAVTLGGPALGSGVGQFSAPSGVAIGPDQKIYVADAGNRRVVRMDDISGSGWVAYTFSDPNWQPARLCVDQAGRIYVLFPNIGKVARMDSMTGAGFTTFGSWGSGPGQLLAPQGIAVGPSGAIYVCDRGNDRIVRITDMTGAGWQTHSTGDYPYGIFVDSSERIWLAGGVPLMMPAPCMARMDDMSGAGLVRFGLQGGGTGQFLNPMGMCITSAGKIVVADRNNDRVVQIDDIDCSGWQAAYGWGSVTGSLGQPIATATDSAGRVYILDYDLCEVIRVDDMSGAGWTVYGKPGEGAGCFRSPCALAIGPDDRIYVADAGNNRVTRMDDMSGAGWTTFGTGGPDTGQFNYPCGLAVDGSSRIWVADALNHRIVRMYDMAGAGLATLDMRTVAGSGYLGPSCVAIDTAGRVVISDGDNNVARIDDISGAGFVTYGSAGSGVGQFNIIRGLFVDGANRIYVADAMNNRIARIDDMTGAGWTTYTPTGAALYPGGLGGRAASLKRAAALRQFRR